MEEKCKVCGCTDYKACEGGCYWVAEELCNKCAEKLIEEIKKLKEKLKKIEWLAQTQKEIIEQQPSKDKEIDSYFVEKLNTVLSIIKGDE